MLDDEDVIEMRLQADYPAWPRPAERMEDYRKRMPGPRDEQEITTLGADAQTRELPKDLVVILKVVGGTQPGRSYPITSVPVTLGRDNLSGISFPDPKMSRQHAALVAQGSDFILKDLGSTNGTFINEKRIKQAMLVNGDQLRLGNTVFEFIINQPETKQGK